MLIKSTFRTIKGSLGRYLAILSIIALGVGFFAGLRVTEKAMIMTADQYISECNLFDFRLVSTLGLTEDDVDAFSELSFVKKAVGSVSSDFILKDKSGSESVLHAHALLEGINGVDVLYGRLPENDNECLLDSHFGGEKYIGETVALSQNNSSDTLDMFAYDEYTVVGIVNSSMYINFQRGTTSLAGGKASGYVYIPEGGFSSEYFTEIYLTVDKSGEIYSDDYKNSIDSVRSSIEEALNERADVRYESIYTDAMKEIDGAQTELDGKKEELASAQREVDDGWSAYNSEQKKVRSQLSEAKTQLDNVRAELDSGWEALEKAKTSPAAALPEVQAQLALQEAQLSEGEKQYSQKLSEYQKSENDAIAEFSKTEKELCDAQAEIDDALSEIESAQADIDSSRSKLSDIKPASVFTLDRSTNIGYVSFQNDTGIVLGVAKVFPLFFFLIAALVCITTMTRMVGEQRTQNGILKALGYGSGAVVSQYLIYAGTASVLGCIIGFLIGSKLMPMALWKVYLIMYSIDRPICFVLDWELFGICSALYLICALGATWIVCYKSLRENSAELIRPKAPAAGKRIFLERIGFIWKPLKFLHKVSIRNILRYKKRMVMMIIGIGGCTALLIAGFGIRDTIKPIVDYQYGEISLYDASVSFVHEPNDDEKEKFDSCIRDISQKSIYIYTGSVDVITDSSSTPIDVVVYKDDMSSFINLHNGKTEIQWPAVGETVINYRIAKENGLKVGDTVTLRDSDFNSMTLTVSGIYDNYLGDTAYVSAETCIQKLGYAPKDNMSYIIFPEDSDEHESGAVILCADNVASVSIVSDMKTAVDSMLNSMNYIVLIVLVCAGALAFIVLYNLTNITITERTREIATLKVLGFYLKEQNSYVFRENIILSAISSVCGIPLGIALLNYVMSQIKISNFYFGCRLSPESYVIAILLTILFTVIVDFALIFKTKRINMAEAMKATE